MGLRKDWPELVPILNKVLGSIGDRQRAAIKNTWLAVEVRFGADLKTVLTWVLPIGLGLTLIIVVIVISNRRLSLQIAERKRAERALTESEQQIRRLLETSNEGVWMIDNDGRTTGINRSLSEILGETDGDVRGRFLYEFLDEPSKEIFFEQLEARKRGEATSYAVVVERQDGSTVPVVINGTPMYDASGVKIGSFGMVTDISDVKEKEAELHNALMTISDSINYASNIQRALLTGDDMPRAVTRDSFTIWEPRDTVGGDIYWCHMWGDGILIIQADCTGHGVPGAFMTLIASGALDRAIGEVPTGQVGELIQRVHQIIQISLSQHGGRGQSDDGLELGACFINSDLTRLTYAGARFPLFFVHKRKVSEIKSTKSGLGYRGIPLDQIYEETEITLEDGMAFYLTTDGYLDQIGGTRNWMFGKTRFKKLLSDIHAIPMSEQKQAIRQALIDFQSDQARRDDVSVLGFRV